MNIMHHSESPSQGKKIRKMAKEWGERCRNPTSSSSSRGGQCAERRVLRVVNREFVLFQIGVVLGLESFAAGGFTFGDADAVVDGEGVFVFDGVDEVVAETAVVALG